MEMFTLEGRNAVVVGGGGILGAAMAKGLASAGARVAVLDLDADAAAKTASDIKASGGEAEGYGADAMSEESLADTCRTLTGRWGRTDIMISAVGGNIKKATTSEEVSFFDLPLESLKRVVELNLFAGAVIPARVFGRVMASNEGGASIINVSSMNAFRPLTRIAGYSAAKAAVSNFTQWLAVHLAQNYGGRIRVNAIAPGFFLTNQNRYLLTDKATGELTARGKTIIAHTPMGRFGEPDDLVGTVIWLASDASAFVNGVVVPVDGGFSAFSGV